MLLSSSSSSLVTTELFQRVRGSRPEILDQKRSPDSSVRGKNITLLPSISSSPEESFVRFCFVVGIDNRLSSPANSLLRYIALHRRDLHSLTRRHLSKVCRKRQVHAFLPVEESRTEYSGKNSFSLSLLGSVCIFYVDTFFFLFFPSSRSWRWTTLASTGSSAVAVLAKSTAAGRPTRAKCTPWNAWTRNASKWNRAKRWLSTSASCSLWSAQA